MKDILIDKLENQIQAMFDTVIAIWEEEQKEPMRELSDWHKTALSMTFTGQVLMKSCWNNIFKDKWLDIDQRIDYISKVWELTKEHYKNLYGYDSILATNNWLK